MYSESVRNLRLTESKYFGQLTERQKKTNFALGHQTAPPKAQEPDPRSLTVYVGPVDSRRKLLRHFYAAAKKFFCSWVDGIINQSDFVGFE